MKLFCKIRYVIKKAAVVTTVNKTNIAKVVAEQPSNDVRGLWPQRATDPRCIVF